MHDSELNDKFHLNLWLYFYNKPLLETISPTEAATYEAKFERCQRLVNKESELEAEIRANRRRILRMRGHTVEEEVPRSEEEMKILRKIAVKKYLDATGRGNKVEQDESIIKEEIWPISICNN
jgi:hypothetical protein